MVKITTKVELTDKNKLETETQNEIFKNSNKHSSSFCKCSAGKSS